MRKISFNEWIAISVSLVVVLGFFAFSPILYKTIIGMTNEQIASSAAGNLVNNYVGGEPKTAAGLKIQDVTEGGGKVAKNGSRLTVNYVGKFLDGRKFDSSIDRKEPFTFTLGQGEVIKGWEVGILGMKEGGKRILTIPPDLGYGKNGAGPIPGNSTLVFEVDLLKVQ